MEYDTITNMTNSVATHVCKPLFAHALLQLYDSAYIHVYCTGIGAIICLNGSKASLSS